MHEALSETGCDPRPHANVKLQQFLEGEHCGFAQCSWSPFLLLFSLKVTKWNFAFNRRADLEGFLLSKGHVTISRPFPRKGRFRSPLSNWTLDVDAPMWSCDISNSPCTGGNSSVVVVANTASSVEMMSC